MNLNDKIYVAGHTGLVGSAIMRELNLKGYKNLVTRTHDHLDLKNQSEVQKFFEKEKPDHVILAAAKVGGIHANNSFPADFIYSNLMIETNIIHSSFENNVKKLLFLGSSCIYPALNKQPIPEDSLLTGLLESTNEPYAIAKIAGIKLCESFNRQYKTDFRSVMPTNLYGINDNFHTENGHVIPSLIRRIHEAKTNDDSVVKIWGTGNPVRDFLYVDDMARASLFIIELEKNIYLKHTQPMLSHINIGTGKGVKIKKLAELLKDVIGFSGKLIFDESKPDGTLEKVIDVSCISKIGWKHTVNLKDGLQRTYNWYLKNLT